jgi:hypothetical protein
MRLIDGFDGMKNTLLLRLIVTEPLPGVRCAMQRGRTGLLAPATSSGVLTFDFDVQVDLSKDPPGLTGEFAQGPLAKRFVYVNSGTYAGQSGTPWSRRAKVPITGVTASLAAEAIATKGRLRASVRGTSEDGGPFCASVPLLSDWTVVAAA